MPRFDWFRRFAAVVLIFMGLIFSGCSPKATQVPAGLPEVATVTVSPEQVTLTTELPGRISAYLVAEIRPQVSGLLQERKFQEGATVRKGDTLYQIDPAPFQAHPQDPRPTVSAIGIDHRCPRAEINLRFLPRLDLDAPHPLGLLAAELAHEPFDRLIGAAETNFGHQILMNPLRAQARVQLGRNPCAMRIAETGPTGFGLQRRRDQVCAGRFAGGRNGGF